MTKRRTLLGMSLALAVSFAPAFDAAQAQTKDLVIFAAASMKNALDEAAANWVKESSKPAPKISYAASNTLAKQLENGAPADLFVSADLDWMDYAASKNLIKPDTRVSLLANRIVLVAGKDSTATLDLKPGADLAGAVGTGRLAMGNVDSVPAGKYGKAALEKLGAWEKVKDKIAQADNVRAALLLVERGEAPLGIVYETDARASQGVKTVALFPAESHPPISYPFALMRRAEGDATARGFLSFATGAEALPVWQRFGFTLPR